MLGIEFCVELQINMELDSVRSTLVDHIEDYERELEKH